MGPTDHEHCQPSEERREATPRNAIGQEGTGRGRTRNVAEAGMGRRVGGQRTGTYPTQIATPRYLQNCLTPNGQLPAGRGKTTKDQGNLSRPITRRTDGTDGGMAGDANPERRAARSMEQAELRQKTNDPSLEGRASRGTAESVGRDEPRRSQKDLCRLVEKRLSRGR